MSHGERIAFGPVPSRRLGRSLGINNVPPKSCSYSCTYCQIGRTFRRELEPRAFRRPDRIVAAVERRVRAVRGDGERLDFLTFVPDGEPTLDAHLGEEIRGLRALGIPVAVISNGSLLWRGDVRSAVGGADWVSLKVDAVDEETWRRVNRPPPSLSMGTVLDGMRRFANGFGGRLVTETMLIDGRNDGARAIDATAAYVEELGPKMAYVAVPTRPPPEPSVRPARAEAVNRAFQRFADRLPRVELLTGFEGTAFGASGDLVEDLLGITAVHPLRDDAMEALLARAGADASLPDRLIRDGQLEKVEYRGHGFYLRRLYAGREPRDLP